SLPAKISFCCSQPLLWGYLRVGVSMYLFLPPRVKACSKATFSQARHSPVKGICTALVMQNDCLHCSCLLKAKSIPICHIVKRQLKRVPCLQGSVRRLKVLLRKSPYSKMPN